jgi:hypothetical protein
MRVELKFFFPLILLFRTGFALRQRANRARILKQRVSLMRLMLLPRMGACRYKYNIPQTKNPYPSFERHG